MCVFLKANPVSLLRGLPAQPGGLPFGTTKKGIPPNKDKPKVTPPKGKAKQWVRNDTGAQKGVVIKQAPKKASRFSNNLRMARRARTRLISPGKPGAKDAVADLANLSCPEATVGYAIR